MLSITNQDKLIYEAPTTIVVEVKTEGVICQSPGNGGGMPGGEPALPF